MANVKMVAPNQSPKYTNLLTDEYVLLPQKERDKYVYNAKKHVYELDELLWKKQRQHWIGYENPSSADYVEYTVTGSEAGSIAVTDEVTRKLLNRDLHTFKCKSELWYEKMGITIPLSKPNTSEGLFEGGHLFESICAQALESKLNKEYPEHVWEVIPGERMYQYGERDENGQLVAPWLIATPDGFVLCDGEVEGLAEFKNIQPFSPNAKLVKQNIVPAEYYTQGSHYMIATATKRIFYMVAMGNNYPADFHMLQEKRDELFCNELFRVEKEFVQSLENGIEPPTDGSDGQNLTQLHELLRRKMGNYKPDVPPVEVTEDLTEIIEEISFIDSDIDLLKEKIKELEEQRHQLLVKHILPKAGDANEIRVPRENNSYFSIQLKDSKPRLTVNPEEIKIKEPEVYEKCLEKKFSTDYFKIHYPELYKKYARQSDNLTDTKKEYVKIRIGQTKVE